MTHKDLCIVVTVHRNQEREGLLPEMLNKPPLCEHIYLLVKCLVLSIILFIYHLSRLLGIPRLSSNSSKEVLPNRL